MIVDAQGAQDRIRVATALLQAAADHGVTLAIAESLTGGQVSSSLVEVPGASRVLVGTVVAYATRIKAQLLGSMLRTWSGPGRWTVMSPCRWRMECVGSLGPIWDWRPPGWPGRGRPTDIRPERSISPSSLLGGRGTASCT